MDTLRTDHVARTKNISRLIRESVFFTQAYAQFPSTVGSLNSFLSGKYPIANVFRRSVEPTWRLERSLMENGYRCFAVSAEGVTPIGPQGITSFRSGLGTRGPKSIRGQIDRVAELLGEEHDEPRFVWFHLMTPHV